MIPVYNVEAYLPECLESVLSQSYGNFEIILVDDGSPDNCGKICDDYAAKDSRIKVFHKPNGGLMHTRRFALERAQGDYYIFLDSDDYIMPGTLEILESNIRRTDADCVIYGLNWLLPGGTKVINCLPEYENKLICDKAYILSILLNGSSYNALWRKCVRASCFDGRDFSPYFYIKSGEDRIQSVEILENAKSFLFIPHALYCYRVNNTSITHTVKYDNYKADFTVDEFCLDLIKRLGVFTENDYNRLRNFALDSIAVELKRISRFCSDKENMVQAFDRIRSSDYYKDFLFAGYKKAPALPGVAEKSGLRRMLNKLLIRSFAKKQDALTIFISRYIYK